MTDFHLRSAFILFVVIAARLRVGVVVTVSAFV